MHAEYYELSEETAATAREAQGRRQPNHRRRHNFCANIGNRCRPVSDEEIQACSGWTDIFIYPGLRVQAGGCAA